MTEREQELQAAADKIDVSSARMAGLVPDTASYQREAFLLIEEIYLYLNLLSGKYADKGLEIVETVHDCLKHYDSQKGPFRNYFMAAIKRRMAALDSPSVEQSRGGMVLSRHDRQRIKAVIALSHKTQCPLDSEHLPTIAAEILQETPEEIQRLLSMNAMASIASETRADDQPEDRLASIPSELHLEDEVLDGIRAGEILRKIDQAFQGCHQAQRPVISKLLTARILAELPDLVKDQQLWQYEFWNEEIYQGYLRDGTIPSARQISVALGRNEASTCRTFKQFLQKIETESDPVP